MKSSRSYIMFGQKYRYNMLRLLKCLLLVSLVITLLMPRSAIAVQSEQITITSNTMTASNKGRRAIFREAVILTQGDLVVRSDVMVVRFKQDKESTPKQSGEQTQEAGRKIDLIEAKGKVVIEKASGRATCRHAVYHKDEEKIVLTGSPVAWQGGTRVSGPKMTMYLEENRSVVEGGTRVIIDEQEGN